MKFKGNLFDINDLFTQDTPEAGNPSVIEDDKSVKYPSGFFLPFLRSVAPLGRVVDQLPLVQLCDDEENDQKEFNLNVNKEGDKNNDEEADEETDEEADGYKEKY